MRHNQLLDNSVFQYIVNLLILLLHWPERQCSTMLHQNVWEGEVEVGPQWLPGPQHMSHHVCPKNRYETWLSLKFNLMKSNVSKWFIICFNLFPSWWEPLWWDSLFSHKILGFNHKPNPKTQRKKTEGTPSKLRQSAKQERGSKFALLSMFLVDCMQYCSWCVCCYSYHDHCVYFLLNPTVDGQWNQTPAVLLSPPHPQIPMLPLGCALGAGGQKITNPNAEDTI